MGCGAESPSDWCPTTLEDESTTLSRNVGQQSPTDTAQHTKRTGTLNCTNAVAYKLATLFRFNVDKFRRPQTRLTPPGLRSTLFPSGISVNYYGGKNAPFYVVMFSTPTPTLNLTHNVTLRRIRTTIVAEEMH